jgi:hypothetical protein
MLEPSLQIYSLVLTYILLDVECLNTIYSLVLTDILLDVECFDTNIQLGSDIYIVRRWMS